MNESRNSKIESPNIIKNENWNTKEILREKLNESKMEKTKISEIMTIKNSIHTIISNIEAHHSNIKS